MDDLIQANLELHAELGKEVRINLENEAKISRLEKQQVRYEEDIQYLYGIIEKLEVRSDYSKKEKDSLILRISKLQSQLRNSEETCDKKEKFILFRESQLSELEKTIYKLKNPNSDTFHSKMASSSKTLKPSSFEGMSNDELVGEVKRLNVTLNNCIEKGQMLKTALADQSAESKSLIHRLEKSLESAQAEIEGKDAEIFRLGNICDEQNFQIRNGINQVEERDRHIGELNAQLEELIGVSERVERNSDNLLRESEQVRRNLEMANRVIGERDVLINQYRNRLNNLQDERDVLVDCLDIAWARFMTERLETRSLRRQRLALRIANRQLQIRLMNPGPIIAPPPPIPQPVDMAVVVASIPTFSIEEEDNLDAFIDR